MPLGYEACHFGSLDLGRRALNNPMPLGAGLVALALVLTTHTSASAATDRSAAAGRPPQADLATPLFLAGDAANGLTAYEQF